MNTAIDVQDFIDILDGSDQRISVCSQGDFQLLYANKAALRAVADPAVDYDGLTCHKFFMGLDEACPFCPLKTMGDQDEVRTIYDDGEYAFDVVLKRTKWLGQPVWTEYVSDVTAEHNAQRAYERFADQIIASIPNAYALVHMNLTHDIFEVKVAPDNSTTEKACRQTSINKMVSAVATAMPNALIRRRFMEISKRESLIQLFTLGQSEVDLVVNLESDKDQHWVRMTYKMLQHPLTGDIECFVYSINVDEEHAKVETAEIRRRTAELAASEEKTRNDRIRYTDDLTNILNAHGFYEYAASTIKRHPMNRFALLYSDIQNLTFINNKYGMEVGNQLIRQWAQIINGDLRRTEYVCRLSGGKFGVLVDLGRQDEFNIDSIADMQLRRYENLRNLFLTNQAQDVKVSIYTGCYMVSPGEIHKMPISEMLELASLAHKRAKSNNSFELTMYNPDAWEKQKRIESLANSFEKALKAEEFVVWYQPQYDNISQRIVGAEVLCRWFSSEYGFVSPGEFVPIFETRGLIVQLDKYIWECACKQLRFWADHCPERLIPLSINISRYDFMVGEVCPTIFELVEKYDIDPKWLRLEITESIYSQDIENIIHSIEQLRSYGFIVEMDDFGSGYSSLNSLKGLPVDVLKLDMRFVQDAIHNESSRIIISSVINMAHSLNLSVIAEGVESMEQNELLRDMGCHVIQGFFFYKPMPIEELHTLLFETCAIAG